MDIDVSKTKYPLRRQVMKSKKDEEEQECEEEKFVKISLLSK